VLLNKNEVLIQPLASLLETLHDYYFISFWLGLQGSTYIFVVTIYSCQPYFYG